MQAILSVRPPDWPARWPRLRNVGKNAACPCLQRLGVARRDAEIGRDQGLGRPELRARSDPCIIRLKRG